jgi:hypothetical protein
MFCETYRLNYDVSIKGIVATGWSERSAAQLRHGGRPHVVYGFL